MSEEQVPYSTGSSVSATLPTAAIVPTALPSAIVLHVQQEAPPPAPTFNLKTTKNSKGYGFEITVLGARSVAELIALAAEARQQFEEKFGPATE